jgi:hypothetical protein
LGKGVCAWIVQRLSQFPDGLVDEFGALTDLVELLQYVVALLRADALDALRHEAVREPPRRDPKILIRFGAAMVAK